MTTDNNTSDQWVVIQPHDTVHVRDGRPMPGGEGGTATTVNPWPSTVAGAMKAALGGEPDAVAGPILAQEERPGEWISYFSIPTDLIGLPNSTGRQPEVWRLHLPHRQHGSSDMDDVIRDGRLRMFSQPDALLNELIPIKSQQLTGLISSEDMSSYLKGEIEPNDDVALTWTDSVIHDEERIGIGLDSQTRTVKDGMLYQVTHRRLEEGWAFAACLSPGRRNLSKLNSPVRFGGLSRMADVRSTTSMDWPDAPTEFPDGRVLVYLVTPGVWEDGWKPPFPDGTLVAAMAGDPIPVASASPHAPGHEGSRTNRRKRFQRPPTLAWAVPPGSIYCLQFPDSDTAAEWAGARHGRALGPAARDRWDTAGFGVILTGVW